MRIYVALILICLALFQILIWAPLFPSFGNANSNPFRVFLGCSGNDVRKGFADHLHRSLIQEGVSTFCEDNGIPDGENSGLALKKAFYGTQFGIVIFSNEYPKSMTCLDELEMIMKRKEADGYIVVPLYFNVNKSDVVEQTGTFAQGFAELERRSDGKMDKVEKWRKVLEDVANIQGWSLNNGYESPFIRRIVDDIKDKRNSRLPYAAHYFILKILLSMIGILSTTLLIMALKRSASPEKLTCHGDHGDGPREGDFGELLQEGDGKGGNMDATS